VGGSTRGSPPARTNATLAPPTTQTGPRPRCTVMIQTGSTARTRSGPGRRPFRTQSFVSVHPGGFGYPRTRAWRAHRDGRVNGRGGRPTGRLLQSSAALDVRAVPYCADTASVAQRRRSWGANGNPAKRASVPESAGNRQDFRISPSGWPASPAPRGPYHGSALPTDLRGRETCGSASSSRYILDNAGPRAAAATRAQRARR
jgi:hypothetical protein